MPYKVQEIYPAQHQHYLVVAGGLSPDVSERQIDVSHRVIAFDLNTQQWLEWPVLPTPRHHPHLLSANGKLYAIGGFTVNQRGAWQNDTAVLVLSDSTEATHQWQTIAQMPEPLSETLSTLYDGKIHIVTGRSPIDANTNGQWRDHSDSAAHWIFDLASQTWSAGEPAPTARNSACGARNGDDWHTIAGRTVNGGNTAVHEVYNLQTGTWRTLAPLPDAQGGLACATVGDKIYVFGGEYFNDGGGVYDTVWMFDLTTGEWQSVDKMPLPRHGLGALTVGSDIYVIGGAAQAGGNETSARMSIYTPTQ
ncbi:kelch repeat-containing protein [Alteromonas sp. ASW11-36]|uniref:Kelch repeat-containing protein n=1 Tax=Alteromonas arenosi TaxID=3055817 RepID=A0ABT7SWV5_9ALTE|nr:kelch repeat-containing protein [Alteromonas sp. ASW11-36]MDM7860667.1 kelch repeat-containing protein [Alteromonas sp. ASW11-36]